MKTLILILALYISLSVSAQNNCSNLLSIQKYNALILPETEQMVYIFVQRNFGIDACIRYEKKDRWEQSMLCVMCGFQTVQGLWILQEEIPLSGTSADNNSRYDFPIVYNTILQTPTPSPQNKAVYIKPQGNIRL
ncbi:MAG: hypothetical protein ACT6QS_03355 [Flavobacteriales bacterium]